MCNTIRMAGGHGFAICRSPGPALVSVLVLISLNPRARPRYRPVAEPAMDRGAKRHHTCCLQNGKGQD